MSNVVNMSNASSALNSVLQQVDTNINNSPFSYRYAQDLKGSSMSGVARQYQEIQPNGSKVFGTVDFPIPKAGILQGLIVKLKLSKTATFAVNNSIGALQIREMSLVTNGRVLYTQTAQTLLSQVADQPYESRRNLEDMMHLLGGTTGDQVQLFGTTTGGTAFVPALFSCFDCPENMLNTSFVEPLILRLKLAGASDYCAVDASVDTLASVTLDDLTCICSYVQLPASVEQAMISSDFGSGENLSKVGYDFIEESSTGTLSTSATDSVISHEIKTNRFITDMYLVVTGENDHSDTVDNAGMGIELSNIKVESNGQVLMDLPAKIVGNIGSQSLDDFGYGCGSYWDRSSRVDGGKFRYVVRFSLSKDYRRIFGGCSTRELNNFKISCSVNSVLSTQTSGTLTVCMRSPQLLSFSAESGRITSSISS